MARLLLVALWVSAVSALVEELIIENDSRRAFHIESFGFEPNGHVEFSVTDFGLMVPQDFRQPEDGKFNVAFVLQYSVSEVAARMSNVEKGFCFHENSLGEGDEVIPLSSRSDWTRVDFERTITKGGYYHLYFSNCEKKTHSGFQLNLAMYNIDASGHKVYLSVGQQSLPNWFFVICTLFVIQLVVWVKSLFQHRVNIRSIHYLMTIVLVFKILTLFCESFKFHSLKTTGHNNGWSVMFYIFSFVKGILMFSVIVLIGTGWSYLKPFLTDRDKQIMLAVMVVQLMVNIAMVVVDEMAPGSAGWIAWADILRLLDILCCCVILLPIIWSIRHLRKAAAADGKMARNADRLKNFRTFYLSVVSYIYFTRIVVYLMNATLPFETTWLGTIFAEAAAFLFYGITGYLFRPQGVNPYLALGGEQEGDKAENAVLLTEL